MSFPCESIFSRERCPQINCPLISEPSPLSHALVCCTFKRARYFAAWYKLFVFSFVCPAQVSRSMTRRVDANWRGTQQTTLEKWLNSTLKAGPVQTSRQVTNLKEDLKDGEIIAVALENLTASSSSSKGGRVRGLNRRAILEVQKRENLIRCFDHMKKEGIKLVNIGTQVLYYCLPPVY